MFVAVDRLKELRIRYVRTRRVNPYASTALRKPEDAYELFRHFSESDREQLIVVHLDGRMRVACYEVAAIGSTTACLFSPKEILKSVLLSNSVAFILIHNHPSGDPEPSGPDLEAMRQIEEGALLIGLSMLDYMVIGDNSFWSLKDQQGSDLRTKKELRSSASSTPERYPRN